MWALARSRFVWQFTLSKVFADPVWYFYTFWFPQYLKVGRGFTMKQIGQAGWIPFFTAGIGNLAGGFLCSWLLKRGLSAQTARRVGVLVFSALMMSAVPAAMVPRSFVLDRSHLHCDLRLQRGAGECAGDSAGSISQECRGLDLGFGQHGFRVWGDGLQPGDRLAG